MVEGGFEVDDRGLHCRLPDGAVLSLTWGDLAEVSIVTTDQGPVVDDVFFVLKGADGSELSVPQTSPGATALFERLQALPGFDHERFIQAMSSAQNARFVCWRRPREK